MVLIAFWKGLCDLDLDECLLVNYIVLHVVRVLLLTLAAVLLSIMNVIKCFHMTILLCCDGK